MRLRSSIPTGKIDPLLKLKEAMVNREWSFKFKSVNCEEVEKIIHSLKNSSATGVDYIDTRTLKLSADILSPAI